MSLTAGVQLSFEVTKAFPVRALVEAAGSRLLKYAKDLRKSGSDIVVEADLDELLDRGKVNSEIEAKFKNVVKVQKFTPLRPECEVTLDSGPSTTVLSAFRGSQHFATIIQLLFLG